MNVCRCLSVAELHLIVPAVFVVSSFRAAAGAAAKTVVVGCRCHHNRFRPNVIPKCTVTTSAQRTEITSLLTCKEVRSIAPKLN